jgi:hypothetical protein
VLCRIAAFAGTWPFRSLVETELPKILKQVQHDLYSTRNNKRKNKKLKYLSIPEQIVLRIRTDKRDAFGHEVETHIAGEDGYGPCRCCLKQFKPGEERLLFSYAPVGADHAYNEVGPVYIHTDCEPFADAHTFPPEVKNGRMHIPLVLRCYNSDRRMIDGLFVKNNHEVETVIQKLFERQEISFIHVRNAVAQCFIVQVER